MHYYKRNLGDYAKKAGRLSMLQHGSYTLLIDACYDREQFPTLEEAIEWTWASTTEEIEAVTFVLRKFFVLTDGVYVQKRIQEELASYHETSETNKRIAVEREAKRKESLTNRARSVNEPPPNHKPLTINQEPRTNTPSSEGVARTNEGAACIAMKSAGMASVNPANPKLTELLKAGITVSELADAASDAVSKGKSFAYALATAEGRRRDAATAPLPTVQRQQPKSFAERDRESGWARWEETTNRVHPDRIKADQKSGHVIDISPLNLEIAQ